MMLDQFNNSVQLLLCAVAGWAVMSQRVQDGIVIKAGLITMCLGPFGTLAWALDPTDPPSQHALAAAHALVHVGWLICGLGYWLRTRKHQHDRRRSGDWVNLKKRKKL